MKNTAYSVIFLAFLVSSISAQYISPVPVVETEIRDNSSLKIRSIELDRIKRDAKKKSSENLGPASVNNFLEIKVDFEQIQVLENNIVTVYTTGKEIEYKKIAAFSAEINQSASRLKKNLFSLQNNDQKKSSDEPEVREKTLPNDVKNLIVALDNTIGAFVNNPIFLTPKKAKPKEKEKAEADLEQVIRLSTALKQEAEKQTRPKN
ncbi:MAG TPA: hypothetical protein VNB22_21415 [Pyrinomonadaceae bacterium]|nr:hypothetical protein [Pyrinomonadaceae bacterium]